MRPARKTGRPLKISAVVSETSRAIAKTRKSIVTSLKRGSSPAAKLTKVRNAVVTRIVAVTVPGAEDARLKFLGTAVEDNPWELKRAR